MEDFQVARAREKYLVTVGPVIPHGMFGITYQRMFEVRSLLVRSGRDDGVSWDAIKDIVSMVNDEMESESSSDGGSKH